VLGKKPETVLAGRVRKEDSSRQGEGGKRTKEKGCDPLGKLSPHREKKGEGLPRNVK